MPIWPLVLRFMNWRKVNIDSGCHGYFKRTRIYQKEYEFGFRHRPKEGIRQELPSCPSLLEKGVRVVTVQWKRSFGGNGITNWDSHSNIHKTHAMQAETDQPCCIDQRYETAGIVKKYLGGLVHRVWRMPFLQGNGTRDHNPDAFTCFFAGAGVKGYTMERVTTLALRVGENQCI